MSPTLYELERRTARLERTNRLLSLALAGCLSGLIFIGAAQPDVARSRGFQLIGDDGAVQAELVVRDGYPGLYLKDASGVDRVALFHQPDTDGLFVMDAEATTRIGVAQFSHGGGGFALHGPQSKGAAVLYLKGDGSLRFFDQEGTVTNQMLARPDAESPSSAPVPAGHQPGEEAAVLAAMDRYMMTIADSDFAEMARLQTSEGMTYRARIAETGEMEVVANPNTYWADPANDDGRTNRERYWTPTVLIRGGIAVVWAPYEFSIDGETSHCGVDVWDFIKRDGQWILANSMWTVEGTDACESLWPADPAEIRPAN